MNPTIEFASKLYPKMGTPEENSFYSPFSLMSALGMCMIGAEGKTREALAELLEIPLDNHENVEMAFVKMDYFKQLTNEINNSPSKLYKLITSNTLWAQGEFEFNPHYKTAVKEIFDGTFEEIDYRNKTAACDKINNRCNQDTHGKIPSIVSEDTIKEDTRLILVNAIYFKAKWKEKFPKDKTTLDNFTTQSGEVKKVNTMHQTNDFVYGETEDFQTLEMLYQGNDLSVVILLPTNENVEINKDTYAKAIDSLKNEKVTVSLPKIKISTSYDLTETLKDLGAEIAFSNKADFSAITKQEQLKISSVIHKAFVEWNEEETEAAAATAVNMINCTSFSKPVIPKIFNANHPFIFFIRNKNSGNVLFCGRINDPS